MPPDVASVEPLAETDCGLVVNQEPLPPVRVGTVGAAESSLTWAEVDQALTLPLLSIARKCA